MKSHYYKINLLLIVLMALINLATAQSTKEEKKAAKEALIKSIVETKQYVFIATSMLPTGGRTRQLTSTDFIRIFSDTVISDLPYFGRSYTAVPGSTEGGIRFTSTQNEYSSTPAKKGGWDIVIKPKDVPDIKQVSLFISSSGTTSVNVISNNRSSISYNGYIEERKKSK